MRNKLSVKKASPAVLLGMSAFLLMGYSSRSSLQTTIALLRLGFFFLGCSALTMIIVGAIRWFWFNAHNDLEKKQRAKKIFIVGYISLLHVFILFWLSKLFIEWAVAHVVIY